MIRIGDRTFGKRKLKKLVDATYEIYRRQIRAAELRAEKKKLDFVARPVGRPPIGKVAMTSTERSRRCRARAAERLAKGGA